MSVLENSACRKLGPVTPASRHVLQGMTNYHIGPHRRTQDNIGSHGTTLGHFGPHGITWDWTTTSDFQK